MLYYIFLTITFFVIFYIGQVVGLKIQCDNFKILSKASSVTYLIPLLVILMLFSFMKDSVHDKSIRPFLSYLKLANKSFIALCACAKIIDEIEHEGKTVEVTKTKNLWPSAIRPVQTANQVKAVMVEA